MHILVNGLYGAGDRGVEVRDGLGGFDLATRLAGGNGIAYLRQFGEDDLTEAVSSQKICDA